MCDGITKCKQICKTTHVQEKNREKPRKKQ